MSRGPDPGTALVRALEANARRAGCPVRMTASDWTRWASATFTGARHDLTLEAGESGASVAGHASRPRRTSLDDGKTQRDV